MAKTLAEIRAKLLAEDKKQTFGGGDIALFRHWNTKSGTTSIVRFLPDADEDNDYFWRERRMFKLPFSGIKGQSDNKPFKLQLPCAEMWGGTCPILKEVRPWWDDKSMEKLASTYWTKKSYLFQGFVVETAVDEDETPENPIRRFIMSPQIYKIIRAALVNPDFGEDMPTDYDKGRDFRINAEQDGKYMEYGTSSWSFTSRELKQDERDAIAEHGLFLLNDFMPKQPGDEELDEQFNLFEASVNGELYDPELYKFYKPWSLRDTDSKENSTPKTETPAPKQETGTSVPVEQPTESAGGESADIQKILQDIRSRKSS